MDDAALVGVLHRAGERFEERGGFTRAERALLEPSGERAAGDVLQREKREAFGRLADLVELDDVRVRQPGGGLGLGAEAHLIGGIGVSAGEDHLERDGSIRLFLDRLVDDTHAAAAEHSLDAVAGHLHGRSGPAPRRLRRRRGLLGGALGRPERRGLPAGGLLLEVFGGIRLGHRHAPGRLKLNGRALPSLLSSAGYSAYRIRPHILQTRYSPRRRSLAICGVTSV